jgi:hypothetical protein
VVIGAVILDKIEAAHLISTTGSLDGAIASVVTSYNTLIGLLVVIVVVVVACVIIRAAKGMNNA